MQSTVVTIARSETFHANSKKRFELEKSHTQEVCQSCVQVSRAGMETKDMPLSVMLLELIESLSPLLYLVRITET